MVLKTNAVQAEEGGPETALMDYYETLLNAFGPQGWWPGRTRLEVIVGAILTQNTAWTNVEKAIKGLKKEGLLNPEGLRRLQTEKLAAIIRPAGYFNVKAARLKNFLRFLFKDYGGSLTRLFSTGGGGGLRERILEVNGIGPETADSILLYAGRRAEFVVDAYTKRVFSRHGFVKGAVGYEELKGLFMENLPLDVELFNEYHALIVRVGKYYCRPKKPLCRDCPLKVFLK
ncbi:MAG: endonuclease III domain-containing protein [Thermodesulfobacteriota bacterium]